VAEMAYRLSGSSDLYQDDGRRPYASINFVTAHDGFTLNDLVSYNEKHNQANGEENRDGTDHNLSWNCGVEGPTDDPEIIALRERQKRNFLATLLVSQGVPMILGGDEIGRTQRGNNNAYCQDNDLSWFDWDLTERDGALRAFTQRLLRIRREQPLLRRQKFYQGHLIPGSNIKDITWLRTDGEEMGEDEWQTSFIRALGVRLAGDTLNAYDERGEPWARDAVLLLMNAHHEDIPFALPEGIGSGRWDVLVDTDAPEAESGERLTMPGEDYNVTGRSLVLLSWRT